MKGSDVKCPICGTVNEKVYLEETDGWLICKKCHSETKACGFIPTAAIPEYDNIQDMLNEEKKKSLR